jgi:hypothetical protein
MLKEISFNYFGFFLNFSALFKISPLQWNRATQKWTCTFRNGHTYILWCISWLQSVIYLVYLIIRLIDEIKHDSEEYGELFLILMSIIAYIWAVGAHYALYQVAEVIPAFLEQLLSMDSFLTRKILKFERK